MQHLFEFKSCLSIEYAPSGNHAFKLNWLQRRLICLSPKTVWLFNHHQDSVAVSAVQPNLSYHLKFFHHGDHHLCLGVYLKYADHIDLHPMGFHNCRKILSISDNKYMPLVAKDFGCLRGHQKNHIRSGVITCTAAGFNKLEVPYPVQYVDVIPELLRTTGGKHIHIGRLSKLAIWHIRRALRNAGVDCDAFIYVPHVPSVWLALQKYRVDLYIASFPYGGGRTLVEVMGAGVPVAVHSHIFSRMLGASDMAYEGAFVWRDPTELYDFIRHISYEQLAVLGNIARQWYDCYHREEILQRALSDPDLLLTAPKLRGNYLPDELQMAIQCSSEVTLRGVLLRSFFRFIRFCKTLIV